MTRPNLIDRVIASQFTGALPAGEFDLSVLHAVLVLLAAIDGSQVLSTPAAETVRQLSTLLGAEHGVTQFVAQRLNSQREHEARA